MATEKKEGGNGLLDDFSLDDGEDFFGIKEEENNEKDVTKSIKKDKVEEIPDDDDDDSNDEEKEEGTEEKKKKPAKKGAESKKEEDVKFFDKEDEDEDTKVIDKEDKTKKKEDKEDETKDDEEDEDDLFTNLASDLKEKGIFSNAKIPKDKKITEEEFFKMHDEEIESRVTETFESIFEELGKEGSDFLKYVSNGGNPRTFLGQISNRFNLDELDVENDAQVSKTLRHYLTNFEKVEEDDIEDRMKWLEDGGKKKAYATKYFKVIKDTEKEIEEEILKQQKTKFDNKQIEIKEFNDSLKDTIGKVEAVGSFNINKSEQKQLLEYITKPTVKVGKNKYIPEFQNKLAKILRGGTDKDKERLIATAKIFKEDFNLPDLITKVETKVASKAKSRLASGRSSVRNVSSGGSVKSLADFMT